MFKISKGIKELDLTATETPQGETRPSLAGHQALEAQHSQPAAPASRFLSWEPNCGQASSAQVGDRGT